MIIGASPMALSKPELVDVVFLIPPLVGSLVGSRYAQSRTKREAVTAYLVSVVMGVIVGGGAAEHFELGPWVMGGIMFTVSAIGQEILAYIIAALRQGVTDPASAAGKWIDALFGRRP